MLPLVGKVQHYAWGKLGSESAVARLQVRQLRRQRQQACARAPSSWPARWLPTAEPAHPRAAAASAAALDPQRDGRGVAVDEDEPYAEYW